MARWVDWMRENSPEFCWRIMDGEDGPPEEKKQMIELWRHSNIWLGEGNHIRIGPSNNYSHDPEVCPGCLVAGQEEPKCPLGKCDGYGRLAATGIVKLLRRQDTVPCPCTTKKS